MYLDNYFHFWWYIYVGVEIAHKYLWTRTTRIGSGEKIDHQLNAENHDCCFNEAHITTIFANWRLATETDKYCALPQHQRSQTYRLRSTRPTDEVKRGRASQMHSVGACNWFLSESFICAMSQLKFVFYSPQFILCFKWFLIRWNWMDGEKNVELNAE